MSVKERKGERESKKKRDRAEKREGLLD